MTKAKQPLTLGREIEDLQVRLQEAESVLRAIRSGEVDALVVSGPEGEQVFTLQTAEHAYRVLVETMNEGAVMLDENGTILYCNESFASLLKMAPERVIGSALGRFVVAPDLPQLEALLHAGHRGNSKGEVMLIGGDQRRVPVYLSFGKISLEGMPAVSMVVTDLTTQKRQQELIASERLSRLILDQAAEATVVCDGDGVIIQASRLAHDLCDCNLMLQPFDEVLPLLHSSAEGSPASQESAVSKLFFSMIAAKEELRGLEVIFHRRDGQRFDLLLSAGRVLDLKDRVLGYVLTLIDITERKRAEAEREQLLAREHAARTQAEEAGRMKDEFLATISHELRTPLNAMFGWTRLLRAGNLDQQAAAQAIEVIDRNARAQAQLIDDLLDISRIITGRMRLDVQTLDPIPLIEVALESVRPAADAKGVRLQPILDPQAGPISGDANRIQQVVWNLLSNAIKFTPKGGRVQVRLERVNSHVEMTVSDTGQGIRSEFLPYVFDRFRQADSSNTRSSMGLGLGLAIVRQLIELHGGAVCVESEGEGKGSTFTVKLPVIAVRDQKTEKDNNGSGVARPEPIEALPSLNGVRVLIVDDKADARDLLIHVFKPCGAQVKTAASADEGLIDVKDWRPDVIISDIEMPGTDGYSFMQQVRAWEGEHGGWTPAIALTAYARRSDRLRTLSAGFQMHVTKPVEPNELVTVVASLIQQKKWLFQG
jgi:PAS domain S-box-containing protein